jgi:hypothetical protein
MSADEVQAAIRAEWRAVARVVKDALLMIVRFLEKRYDL